MDWAFFKKDLQYIFLNQIVSSIPSWTIRNFFYKCSGMKIGPKARIGINTVIISPKAAVWSPPHSAPGRSAGTCAHFWTADPAGASSPRCRRWPGRWG